MCLKFAASMETIISQVDNSSGGISLRNVRIGRGECRQRRTSTAALPSGVSCHKPALENTRHAWTCIPCLNPTRPQQSRKIYPPRKLGSSTHRIALSGGFNWKLDLSLRSYSYPTSETRECRRTLAGPKGTFRSRKGPQVFYGVDSYPKCQIP